MRPFSGMPDTRSKRGKLRHRVEDASSSNSLQVTKTERPVSRRCLIVRSHNGTIEVAGEQIMGQAAYGDDYRREMLKFLALRLI